MGAGRSPARGPQGRRFHHHRSAKHGSLPNSVLSFEKLGAVTEKFAGTVGASVYEPLSEMVLAAYLPTRVAAAKGKPVILINPRLQ
eukprot:265762-Rhodomonas_salina.1